MSDNFARVAFTRVKTKMNKQLCWLFYMLKECKLVFPLRVEKYEPERNSSYVIKLYMLKRLKVALLLV